MTKILFAVLALLLLAACGDSEGASDDTPSPSPTTRSSSTPGPGTDTASPSAAPTAAPTVPPEGLSYTVVSGDTLGAIATRYGVTVDAIVAANGIADPAALQVGQVLIIPGADAPTVTAPPTSGSNPTPPPTSAPPPAGGVGLLTLVDKQHALPSDYLPPGLSGIPGGYLAPGYSASLRGDVIAALTQMIDASGFGIRVVSGYRSYSQQVATFNYWVSVLGYDEAVRVSAMAGHSEHQLGSTVDLGTAEYGWDLTEGFGATAAGQWLKANAHSYGFALSYPAGGEPVTGYSYEPWHFRYIGVAEATAWKASGLTLNQYLGG